MNEDPQRAYTRRVLEESERTIARVEAMLERHKRFLADRGLDEETVQRHIDAMSPEARERLQRQMDQVLNEARDQSRQEAAHAQFASAPAPRVRRLRNRV